MMLSPDFLDGLPDSLVKLYEIAERDILADMARRIGAYDYWISSAEHQKQMLKEMGAEEAYIYQRLALLTGKSVEQLKALFITAANETIDSDGEYYKVAGKKPEKLDTSKNLQKVLNSGMKQTGKTFKNLTRTTAGTSAAAFIKALDRAWMQISTGAFDHDTAIRTAIKTLSEKGLQTINYGSGKKTSIEAAVRRALLTGLNQTALHLQETLAEEMENDLVEVTAHSGARPDHAKWQGGIYSLSGRSKKYESLKKATGYGTGEGLGGWNCRHNFFPYIEGSPRTYTKESLKAMEARDIEYNGEKMTKYEASQKQRYIERQIRRWKRENAAMKAAKLDTEESAVKIKSWQARQRDFTEKTGLKRQFERERTADNINKNSRKSIENTDKSSTIKPTKVISGHSGTPKKAEPNAVIDHTDKNGKVDARGFYDDDGLKNKDIHTTNHGNPKMHAFGKNGEHAHDYEWEDNGRLKNKVDRELNKSERKENSDIL